MERNSGNPLKVLHIMWQGQLGGAERAIYQLVREQMNDPTLAPALAFCQSGGQYWEMALTLGCPVINLKLPSGSSFWRIPRIVPELRPFAVHHFHSADVVVMLASLFCPGAWRVYTHRGGQVRYPLKKQLHYECTGLLTRFFFQRLSGNTAHGARAAAQLFHLPSERIQVTYNPIDFDLLKVQRSAEVIRQELGLSRYHSVIGTSANLRPWKRIERLIQAIAALNRPEIGLLIVGDGMDRLRLETLTDQLNVRSQVVFAGKQSNIADYLQVMDVYCLPSASDESFGNAIVEAMAMSLPSVIFFDGGGMVEHIQHDETGFIVDDQSDLEKTLLKLVENPAFARLVGKRAALSVRQKYNRQRAAAQFRKLYPISPLPEVSGGG